MCCQTALKVTLCCGKAVHTVAEGLYDRHVLRKLQDQREEGLKGFRDGSFPVLVATDVAGRGIDVPDVSTLSCYLPLDVAGSVVLHG